MNRNLLLSRILILFFVISYACNFNKQNTDSELITELKDVFNAYEINYTISNQIEVIYLLIDQTTEDDYNDQIESFINQLNTSELPEFNNQTLSKHVKDYIQMTIANYKVLKDKGINSSEFEADSENYKFFKTNYFKYLTSTYALNKYTNLTEEEYWSNIDKKNYIKSTQYSEYEKLKESEFMRSLDYLKKIISQTKNFQEKSIYLIELSDQHVKKSELFKKDAYETAIKKYKSIIDTKKYSLYLFETWMKWRAVTQQTKGLSTSSEIPNNEYDEVRKKISKTILNYLKKNPNDEMAINQFLLIATHDIVRRYGDYPFGNQSTIEFHQMFD